MYVCIYILLFIILIQNYNLYQNHLNRNKLNNSLESKYNYIYSHLNDIKKYDNNNLNLNNVSIGYLININNNDKYKILYLYYDNYYCKYYVHDNIYNINIYLKHINKIHHNDKIKIPEYNNAEYIVNLNRDLDFIYSNIIY